MSKFLKDILKTCFKNILGGGSNQHRCQAPNPSKAKLYGPLPSPEELHEFEQSYAGTHTPELMERHSGWSAGTIQRNKTCLVCLKSTRGHKSPSLLCTTCPRTIHLDCLDDKAPHDWHKQHCPACVKRRWNLMGVLTAVQLPDQSDDDYYMQRVRRYHRWHRYNCQHIQEWQRLHDDGSLESDRHLLIDMCVVRRKPVKVETASKDGEAGGGGRSHEQQSGEISGQSTQAQSSKSQTARSRSLQSQHMQSHPAQNEVGKAANYFDPNTSRLGSFAGSVRSSRSHRSVASHPARNSRAASIISQTSDRSRRKDTESPQSGARKPASIVSRASVTSEQSRALPTQTENLLTPSIQSHTSEKNSVSKQSAQASDRAKPAEIDSRPGSIQNQARQTAPASNSGSINSTTNRSSISSMPPDSMRSLHSSSPSVVSRRSKRSGVEGTDISRTSTNVTSNTSRQVDQKSPAAERPA